MNIIIQTLVTITVIVSLSLTPSLGQTASKMAADGVDYKDLSVQLLEALKVGETGDKEVAGFASSNLEDIKNQVVTDEEKLAFWINVYNGYIIYILTKQPELYDDRRAFFGKPQIEIAGQVMSFADIEHGILRRGQKGWGLGYISNIFSPSYQRKLRPKERDYKIHFGLNCGAKSCPPVSIFRSEEVHEQLCARQAAYLRQETCYDAENNKVVTSALMSWFRGDFGGKGGAKDILMKEGLIPTKKVSLEFGPYDWSLDLDNFAK